MVVTPLQIASNTLYLFASQGAIRLLSLVVIMALTRYLGPARYGDLTLAYAYWILFATLVEAGLDLTIIREASQKPRQLGRLVSNGFLLRGAFAAGAYLVAMAAIPFLGYDPEEVRLLRLALLMLWLSPFTVVRLIFLVTLKIKLVAVLDVVGQSIQTALILSVVLFQWGSAELVLLMQFAATAVTLSIYLVYGRRLLPHPISLQVDWGVWRMLLKRMWPLMVSVALYTLQIQIARLIVGRMASSAEGGLYALAMNLSMALGFIVTAFGSSVYPLLSRYHKSDPAKFRWLYRFSFRVMMSISLPLALLASLTGQEIITLCAGPAYLPAAPLFAVIVWTQVLHFASTILYLTTLATGQQRFLPRIAIASTLVRLGLHILLLPMLGLMGTAYALLAMYVVAIGTYGLLKATRVFAVDWLRCTLRPAFALLILALALAIVGPPTLGIWLGGLAVYGLLLLLLHSVDRNHVEAIRYLLRQSISL
jgi:O-antigen/teichoic acid export membrane protein